jgi:hypothetical protein
MKRLNKRGIGFAPQGNINSGGETRLPFVNPVLVFVNGNGRFSFKEPTIPVLRSSELAQFIGRYNSARPPSIILPSSDAPSFIISTCCNKSPINWSRTVRRCKAGSRLSRLF